ncbi:MAG: endonuclease III [Treponema sp.]|jgi:endonuclease-3|nr:endonuclease III [Treponema sp.]
MTSEKQLPDWKAMDTIACTIISATTSRRLDWDEIFSILETWKKKYLCVNDGKESSVTALALSSKRNPWVVLVSTILSLRTKDAVTLSASNKLLAKAPNPQSLMTLSQSEIEELIYPAGFYRTKAASLKNIASILIETYEGKVPNTMEALLELPGVGRKTANLVLTEAFNQDAICVDVHVHRICNRIGFIKTKTPDESEMVLRDSLPIKHWETINSLLVLYGQQVCKPVSPLCSLCEIQGLCKKHGVEKSR